MDYNHRKKFRSWSILFALAAVVGAVSMGAHRAYATADQVIYDGQIENGWQSWSWATVNFSNTSPEYNGADTISVTDPSGYEALSLHPPTNFDDSQYVSITFWINGGAEGDQQLNVSGVTGGAESPSTVSMPIAPVANTWTQETVSLAALGVSDISDFAGFDIENATGSPEAAYYVGYVDLDAAPGPTSAVVNVDASNALNTIPAAPLGVNTAVWDGYLTDSNTVPLLQAAGVGTLRYPGGSASDAYHWATNENESTTNFFWNSNAAFEPFMTVVSKPLGAIQIITANYGSNIANDAGGDPSEAAAWVQYANITQGYGIKYWEIGNEVYGNGYYGDPGWEYDLHYPFYNGERTGQSALGPVTYGSNVAVYASAMKAVDPTIKIGAVLELPGSSDDGLLDWNSNVLAQCGTSIDFVILHWYPEYAADNDPILLSDTSQIAAFVSGTKALIDQYCGANAPNVQILVTETNSDAATPGKQMLSTVNALFTADDLQSWLEDGVENVEYWDLRNGAGAGDDSSLLFGTLQYGDEGILSNGSSVTLANDTLVTEPPVDTPFAAYYAIQMLHDLGKPGDTMIGSTSNEPLLTSHAVLNANGNLSVLLMNKDPIDNIATTVNLANFKPAPTGASYTYSPSSTGIATGSVAASSSFEVTLPPYTMETVSIPALAPVPVLTSISPVSAPAGSGRFTLTVNGSSFVPTSVVQWNGTVLPTTFVSTTRLTATALAYLMTTVGTASVTVFTSAPGGGTSAPATFTIEQPAPVLSSISPVSAPAGSPRFTLTITGAWFMPRSVLRWNGTVLPTTFVSTTKLTATALADLMTTAGTASVTVFTSAPGGGTSAPATFTIEQPAPVLSSISPTSTPAGSGRFTLTVAGAWFMPRSVVRWNGTVLPTTFVSTTKLTATALADLMTTAGTASITVFTSAPGGGTSRAATFTLDPPAPVLSKISPTAATAGSAAITLSVFGSWFMPRSVVRWNGTAVATSFVASDWLLATIPATLLADAGTASVTVFTSAPGGGTSSAATFTKK